MWGGVGLWVAGYRVVRRESDPNVGCLFADNLFLNPSSK